MSRIMGVQLPRNYPEKAPTQLAILAIKVYDVFLKRDYGG